MSKSRGQPTKYHKGLNDIVLDLMSEQGYSILQVARKLNVDRKTLYNWSEQNEEFFHTLTRAREYGEAYWTHEFTDMMRSKESQPQLVKLYMANRFNWHDTGSNEESSKAAPAEVTVNIVDARADK